VFYIRKPLHTETLPRLPAFRYIILILIISLGGREIGRDRGIQIVMLFSLGPLTQFQCLKNVRQPAFSFHALRLRYFESHCWSYGRAPQLPKPSKRIGYTRRMERQSGGIERMVGRIPEWSDEKVHVSVFGVNIQARSSLCVTVGADQDERVFSRSVVSTLLHG
jgi:hypothetical protein